MDEVAYMRNVETLYLHVERDNYPAVNLYQRAGYEIVDPYDDYAYTDFTTKINLSNGVFDNDSHLLMQKMMTPIQTWHDP